ncbi:hypothetical protein AAG570_013904 [Ranatra chinensis]|uniref:Nuclear receptor domain-containing protein n=1 Tax=Ranatra chinensis TaxID=642074 RepID=A0ABD0YDP5_9HEMI
MPLPPRPMNQQCKVCNEPAAGFHFGAFTCEGCKFGSVYQMLKCEHLLSDVSLATLPSSSELLQAVNDPSREHSSGAVELSRGAQLTQRTELNRPRWTLRRHCLVSEGPQRRPGSN